MTSKNTIYELKSNCEKFLISTADYHRMDDAGIFEGRPRVELIDGNIILRSPISPYHNSHVDKISRFFNYHLFEKAIVRTQGSIQLDDYSEPEPDLALLKPRADFYQDKAVRPEGIYLLIEVAIETVKKDRTVKVDKYAQAGIAEYWIVIPKEKLIEVYRAPKDGCYLEKHSYEPKDQWEVEVFGLDVRGTDFLITKR
jgi:Uma2 family endonuclease